MLVVSSEMLDVMDSAARVSVMLVMRFRFAAGTSRVSFADQAGVQSDGTHSGFLSSAGQSDLPCVLRAVTLVKM